MSEQRLAALGVRVPDVLLPAPGVDLARWAVVACDQYTSEPDYWERVDATVGEAPSTLRLIYPEVYLNEPDPAARIGAINAAMDDYLASGVLVEHPKTMILVRREVADGSVRWGLIVALDLERYDWRSDSRTLIRATEGTIEDRIPPRRAIREHAPLELPHIVVLISDAARAVIEPLASAAGRLERVYHSALMEGGGQVTGWAVTDESDLAGVADGLEALAASLDPTNPLLFAMGDGNHSLATAKSIWTDLRDTLPESAWQGHPARYCLVELENIYDPGLIFEPIHRVLFGISRERFEAELARHCLRFEFEPCSPGQATQRVGQQGLGQSVAFLDGEVAGVYRMTRPAASIPAGTLQRVIDALVARGEAEVDYIHGAKVAVALGHQPGNLAVFLPPLAKDDFFSSIVADGALPRKTFSLGHAADKRFYLEARRIR